MTIKPKQRLPASVIASYWRLADVKSTDVVLVIDCQKVDLLLQPVVKVGCSAVGFCSDKEAFGTMTKEIEDMNIIQTEKHSTV